MAETTNNVPTKTQNSPAPQQARRRFAGIRREIDSLVEDFFRRPPSSTRRRSFLHIASRRARAAFGAIPAVHFTETDRAYEITSELPSGMDEKNVEVKFAKGVLTIKGEKQEEREEKKKGYQMQERSFGSFSSPRGHRHRQDQDEVHEGSACSNPTEGCGGTGGKKGRRQGRLIRHDSERHDRDFPEPPNGEGP
jgi:HSP20 family protein